MNNEGCKVRPQIVNVNSDAPVFFPFSIKTSKCSGSCNNINDPYAKTCVPNVVKNVNVEAFTLMSTNETRHIKWHETCKCNCRLDGSVCNNRQRWNDDKGRYECKEFIDKGACNKGFIWNPSNCECECDKSCDVGEYFDYESCKCRKELVDKLVEKCTETVEEVLKDVLKIAKTTLAEDKNNHKCSPCSCTLFYFQYFLQLTLKLVLAFLFSLVLKKMLLVLRFVLMLKQQFNEINL